MGGYWRASGRALGRVLGKVTGMWDAGEKVKTGGKPQTKSKLSQQTHEALPQQESKSAVSQ